MRPDRTATLTCEDAKYNVVFTKELEFTDFPLDEVTLWFTNNVIYLPSEHRPRGPALVQPARFRYALGRCGQNRGLSSNGHYSRSVRDDLPKTDWFASA